MSGRTFSAGADSGHMCQLINKPCLSRRHDRMFEYTLLHVLGINPIVGPRPHTKLQDLGIAVRVVHLGE